MDVTQIKKWLCVVCGKTEIIERRTEHTFEGDLPDRCNFDLSTYSNHLIIGGKILKNRPYQIWERLPFIQIKINLGERESPKPSGGICDNCLQEPSMATLAAANHINFADREDLERSARR